MIILDMNLHIMVKRCTNIMLKLDAERGLQNGGEFDLLQL